METFFWVKAKVGRTLYTYGPYLSFDVAAPVLVECLAAFLKADGADIEQATCSITEEAIIDEEWVLINTKVKEI